MRVKISISDHRGRFGWADRVLLGCQFFWYVDYPGHYSSYGHARTFKAAQRKAQRAANQLVRRQETTYVYEVGE